MTAATGYLLAAAKFSLANFVTFLAGLTLISAAANAFNQILEKRLDAQMIRTRRRPLASGQLSSKNALLFASAICAMGLGILYVVGMLPLLLGLLALVSYDLVYTPLKRVTPLSLYIGAIPGALPPLIGAASVTHHISASGLLLFAILFFWQMPHFVAIGWLYREDYARAGFHILAVQDERGSKSAWTGVICSVALFSVLWLAARLHTFGVAWVLISGALAFGFIFYTAQFYRFRNVASARRLFIASNVFLTVTMLAACMDAISRLIRLQ
jgi:protoheme IX farnesyltransferase